MGNEKKNYFQEYIDTMISEDSQRTVLIIKHNNLLFPSKESLDEEKIQAEGYMPIFHRFRKRDIQKPYEPCLDVIKKYVNHKIENDKTFDFNKFLDEANVYSLHKVLFEAYIAGKPCRRTEDILLGEYQFEKRKMIDCIVNMLILISKEQKLFFVISELNLAGLFQYDLIDELLKDNRSKNRIKIVATFNMLGANLSYVKERMEQIIELCENEDLTTEWAYEAEGQPERRKVVGFDLDDDIRVVSDSLMLLECNKVNYFLKKISEYVENNSINFTENQAYTFYTLSFWNELLLENFAGALYNCKMLEAINFEEEKRNMEIKFFAESYKTLVDIYNDEKNAAEKRIEKCEEIAKKLESERAIFRVELLKNMAKYSGWRNLWISENDTEVSNELIIWCEKFKYYNHLAHILVYSYNSDYRKLTTVDGIDERIPEFNKGLEITFKLGNDALVDSAFTKNIMLASIHGYFDVCIYFYNRCVEHVKITGDKQSEAGIYNGLGYSSCGLGRYEDANKYYNNALKLFFELRDANKVIETLYNMGINAILAEAYRCACDCLLEADNILNSLKQSALTCCNISKLYGLIALACFRNGVVYQAYIYLNHAKAFLSNVFGKENEREMSCSDDSMFLIYFVQALFEKSRGEYKKALESLANAEFYMYRSTGAMFFNYPQYVLEKYDILKILERNEEAENLLETGIKYCEKKDFSYYAEKMKKARINEKVENTYDIQVDSVKIKDIEVWIKHESIIKNNEELLNLINLLQDLQKIISQMRGTVNEELSSLIPVFKKKFCLDKVLFIDVKHGRGSVEYSDMDIEITERMVMDILSFFRNERKGFTVSSKNSIDDKYVDLINMFSANGILSFTAIPNFVNDELDAIMLAYIEIDDNWLSRKEHSILDERDFNILSYIMEKICDAIDRQELTEEVLDANAQLQIQMKDMEDLKNLAEEANEAKSRFLANMSHEIRTPINAIIGMNEMIMRESGNDEIKGHAMDINSAARSLLSIINDVLDMSKIESGKLEIIPTEYELANVINDLTNMISKRAADKGIEFILKVNPKLPSILYGDDIRLKQIITNLLTNGVKYTEKGSVTLEIDGLIYGEKVDLSVHVTDTGIGIKKEDLSKLFVAFERIEEERNRNVEGTGLGMNITFSLLNMMNSFLWVESEYGKGSTFSFNLSQKIVRHEEIGDIQEKIKKSSSDYEYRPALIAPNANILVVDDNDMNRKVFMGLLKNTKMNIDQAESGFKCLDMTKDKKYDLIFLDHMMPNMDGIETFHKIREDVTNACNDTPIIILTANAIAGAREQYLEHGFDEYLSKPVVPDKLEKVIAKMLNSDLMADEAELNAYENEIVDENDSKVDIDLSEIPEMDLEYARLVLRDDELIVQTVKDFYKSIDKEIELLNERTANIDDPKMLDEYRIQVHALKSSSKMIGIIALSGLARLCELAAKELDVQRILTLTPILIEELLKTKDNLSIAKEEEGEKKEIDDVEYLKSMLEKVKTSAEDFDVDSLDILIGELKQYKFDDEVEKNIEMLDEFIRNLQMDEVFEMVDKIIQYYGE